MRERFNPAASRLISLRPESASILESPMNNMRSLSHARLGRSWNCLRAGRGPDGRYGVIKRMKAIAPHGKPTRIIRRRIGRPQHSQTTNLRNYLLVEMATSNVTTLGGRPMSSRGHGLPTPLRTRSSSFRQWVVAAPNLSFTKNPDHAC